MRMRAFILASAFVAAALLVHDARACEATQTECGQSGNTFCCDNGKGCREEPSGCNDWVQCTLNVHCLTLSCNGSYCSNCDTDADCGALGECIVETGICAHKPICLSNGSCGKECRSHGDCAPGICTYDENTLDKGVCTATIPTDIDNVADFRCGIGTHAPFDASALLLVLLAVVRRLRA